MKTIEVKHGSNLVEVINADVMRGVSITQESVNFGRRVIKAPTKRAAQYVLDVAKMFWQGTVYSTLSTTTIAKMANTEAAAEALLATLNANDLVGIRATKTLDKVHQRTDLSYSLTDQETTIANKATYEDATQYAHFYTASEVTTGVVFNKATDTKIDFVLQTEQEDTDWWAAYTATLTAGQLVYLEKETAIMQWDADESEFIEPTETPTGKIYAEHITSEVVDKILFYYYADGALVFQNTVTSTTTVETIYTTITTEIKTELAVVANKDKYYLSVSDKKVYKCTETSTTVKYLQAEPVSNTALYKYSSDDTIEMYVGEGGVLVPCDFFPNEGFTASNTESSSYNANILIINLIMD